MSYIERTAKKLLPILTEVKKRMIPDKKKKGAKAVEKMKGKDDGSGSDDDDDVIIDLSKAKGKGKNSKATPFDMKNILGYLN